MKPIDKYPYILNPLFGFTLPNFPFIEDTFDGLTLYELISKSNEELDKIIKNVNVLESNVNILNDNINEVNDIKADKTIVKNVNTTSTSDTYSCNYVNETVLNINNSINSIRESLSSINNSIDSINQTKADKTIVKNANTTSESDTYSCNYLNNNFTKGNYNIVTLAQFEYDDLVTKDNSTLYFIKEV